MLPERLDMTLAFKAIAGSVDLTGTEKRVAVAIIDSFNRKTGQCDPSLGRIAHLLGINRRTVIRAMHRIERVRFVQKNRHGGKSHRNSYEPNWVRFREAEAQWNARQKTKHWNSGATKVSPSECETCHVAGADTVTQTLITNQSNETSAAASAPADLQRSRSLDESKGLGRKLLHKRTDEVVTKSKNGSREAALAAAERRWSAGLNSRYSATPEIYAEIIAAIDAEMQCAATEAEMRKPGAGLRFIHEQLQLSRLKGSSTPIAAGMSRK
jgi:DNA-binding IclR family transcriptional regulator